MTPIMHMLSLLAFLLFAGQAVSQDSGTGTNDGSLAPAVAKMLEDTFGHGHELSIKYGCENEAGECVDKITFEDLTRSCENVKIAGGCIHKSCPKLRGTEDDKDFLDQVIKVGKALKCDLTESDLTGMNGQTSATYRSFWASMLMVVTAALLRKCLE